MKHYQTRMTPTAKKIKSFVNEVHMPPESVASMMSMQVTTYEDTAQMLRAYKRKKSEHHSFFNLNDNEFHHMVNSAESDKTALLYLE